MGGKHRGTEAQRHRERLDDRIEDRLRERLTEKLTERLKGISAIKKDPAAPCSL